MRGYWEQGCLNLSIVILNVFLGTQVTLVNPICLAAYIYASWKFFDDRIHDEEITLIYFFGDDYLDYQKKVPATGVPYVKGYEFKPPVMEISPEN